MFQLPFQDHLCNVVQCTLNFVLKCTLKYIHSDYISGIMNYVLSVWRSAASEIMPKPGCLVLQYQIYLLVLTSSS
jgi:hypothetical protein